MTRRRWIADEWTESTASLLGAQAAHLARVLRARVGQQFDVVTGGSVRRGEVVSVTGDRVEFALHEPIQATAPLPLTMALGIVRFERMEWAIEKLTELGAARIVPLIAQRSEKHLAQAAAKRVERWRKIAREAAQQSRRSQVPEISEAMHLQQYVVGPDRVPKSLRLLLSEREQEITLREWVEQNGSTQQISQPPTGNIYAAVGPEGGWSDSEIDVFAKHGWQSVCMGPQILRTETAAIAVASVLSNSWGD